MIRYMLYWLALCLMGAIADAVLMSTSGIPISARSILLIDLGIAFVVFGIYYDSKHHRRKP